MQKCEICGKDSSLRRCYEHYRCDHCESRESLCTHTDGIFCYDCNKIRMIKRVEAFDGDHDLTQNIVCPYCGYTESDSWELLEDAEDIECPDCENTFHYERIHTIDYSTSKKEEVKKHE